MRATALRPKLGCLDGLVLRSEYLDTLATRFAANLSCSKNVTWPALGLPRQDRFLGTRGLVVNSRLFAEAEASKYCQRAGLWVCFEYAGGYYQQNGGTSLIPGLTFELVRQQAVGHTACSRDTCEENRPLRREVFPRERSILIRQFGEGLACECAFSNSFHDCRGASGNGQVTD